MNHYRQCVLHKPNADHPGRVPGGYTYKVAWLNERDAVVGERDAEWTVMQVGDYRATDKEIRGVHRTRREILVTPDGK